jgi:murein DD-endopeptidase MepM/ murein hydrolase activator NlpD
MSQFSGNHEDGSMGFRMMVVCVALLVVTSAAVCADAARDVRLTAPSSVSRGEGFVCRFNPVAGGSGYQLEWLNKTLDLAVGAGDEVVDILLGVGLNRKPGSQRLRLTYMLDGERQTLQQAVDIKDKTYPTQRLTLPKQMVNLSDQNLSRYYKEKEVVTEVLSHRSQGRFWSLPLARPVPGEVSSAFGLQRFINDQPRSPHKGVDFRGGMGVPIKVCADGIVDLVGDHYFSGRSVYVDHGQGVMSMYFHLSEIDVREGQVVRKGEILGKMGKSGRATGPHLHFGLYLLEEPVDPMPLFGSKR